MDVLAHWPEDEYHPHGLDGCTCDAEAEDPHCKFHGYEAVIRRLRRQLEEAVTDLREEHARTRRAVNADGLGADMREIGYLEGIEYALRLIGGQS